MRLIVLGLYLIAPDCARWQVRTHAVVNQSEMTLDAAALAADLSEALQLQAEGGASAQLLAMEATLREQQDQLAALEAKAEEERARRHGELSAAKAESEMAASEAARVGEEATWLRQQLEAMCAQRDAACTRVEALSAELADEATDRRELEAALEVYHAPDLAKDETVVCPEPGFQTEVALTAAPMRLQAHLVVLHYRPPTVPTAWTVLRYNDAPGIICAAFDGTLAFEAVYSLYEGDL